MNKLIMGCGYLGRRVAASYLKSGIEVTGTVRSRLSAEQLKKLGVAPVIADLDRQPLQDLPLSGSSLFYFIPPVAEGSVDPRTANLVKAFRRQGSPHRLIYLSTTGVYGDCGGAWVDESRAPAPAVPRALRRWDAEQVLRAWSRESGCELVVLRVAGFYGPDKLPLERLRQQLPMVCEEEAPFSNRIHIDDLVTVCLAAMERGRTGEVYNVSDGHPTTMTDYFDRLADIAGLARPPKISLHEARQKLSPGMLSYVQESRRLRNGKMLEELDISLQYPDLQSGIPACFPIG
jgi:nucleoside-diphosphate-sugar epimerase